MCQLQESSRSMWVRCLHSKPHPFRIIIKHKINFPFSRLTAVGYSPPFTLLLRVILEGDTAAPETALSRPVPVITSRSLCSRETKRGTCVSSNSKSISAAPLYMSRNLPFRIRCRRVVGHNPTMGYQQTIKTGWWWQLGQSAMNEFASRCCYRVCIGKLDPSRRCFQSMFQFAMIIH